MTEVTTSFSGRAILAKHKSFALYRPSAVVLAQVLADFPILIGQVTAFLLPIYFMSGLKNTAKAFFTLWIITYVTTLALLGFFRAIGFSFSSFDGASQVSGLAVGLLILYTGYVDLSLDPVQQARARDADSICSVSASSQLPDPSG